MVPVKEDVSKGLISLEFSCDQGLSAILLIHIQDSQLLLIFQNSQAISVEANTRHIKRNSWAIAFVRDTPPVRPQDRARSLHFVGGFHHAQIAGGAQIARCSPTASLLVKYCKLPPSSV
jgi:hypothetical protein